MKPLEFLYVVDVFGTFWDARLSWLYEAHNCSRISVPDCGEMHPAFILQLSPFECLIGFERGQILHHLVHLRDGRSERRHFAPFHKKEGEIKGT